MDKAFLEGLLGASEDAQPVIEAILGKHHQSVAALELAHTLSRAISRAGGRSEKAILALLDTQAIGESEDPAAAAQEAVAQLKQAHDYLFAAPVPPVFAAGAGTGSFTVPEPKTLAGALKEKFGK